MTSWARATADGVSVALYVSPRASRSRVVGEHDGRLKLQIAAPPVDGEANDEVVRFVAATLGVSRSAVRLSAGETSKRKQVEVVGVAVEAAIDLLGASRV